MSFSARALGSVDDLLNRAAQYERAGHGSYAQTLLWRALWVERKVSEHELITRRMAERMARESDACMEHRVTRPDCPNCF
jgi:hypothetical protein